jgi:hypothetical protein
VDIEMVKYLVLDNWTIDKDYASITRMGFFASQGGNLFVQELNKSYGTEHEDDNSQHTITLADNKEGMRKLRDWLNTLDLGGVSEDD